MRIRDPISETEEPYNLVPLTDMVFNLLIFFMCATTFVQVEKEMSLALPRAGTSAAMESPGSHEPLVINIRKDGTLLISGKRYQMTELPKIVQTRKSQSVTIRADENAVVKYFAEVARICREQGVVEARLTYVNGK